MSIDPLGLALLTVARNAIAARFNIAPLALATHPELNKNGATFVTLTQNGKLRGCIGSLQAYRTLVIDVTENAIAAAFRDPRFAPVKEDELPGTKLEVSLLDQAEPMSFNDEADATGQLRPGIDGLILSCGTHRATFLPQVWESLPDPVQFMAQLKLKAGLPSTFWDEKISLARYGVQKWKEK